MLSDDVTEGFLDVFDYGAVPDWLFRPPFTWDYERTSFFHLFLKVLFDEDDNDVNPVSVLCWSRLTGDLQGILLVSRNEICSLETKGVFICQAPFAWTQGCTDWRFGHVIKNPWANQYNRNGTIDKSCGILFVLRKETIAGDRRCLHLPNLLLHGHKVAKIFAYLGLPWYFATCCIYSWRQF